MFRRKLCLILAIALAVTVLPLGMTFAQPLGDYTADDCLDGVWEVRPNQTLYYIAYTCGVTVTQLVAYNNIQNPNLIHTGQILMIPPADWQPGGAPLPPSGGLPPAPTAPPPPPPAGGNSAVSVSIGTPLYSADGRVVDINITVHNLSVTPKLAGGRYYPNQGIDAPGGPHWVTLLGAIHDTIPHPYVTNEPLWHATIYTNDGLSFPAYAGCIYHETIFAEGDEPLDRKNNIWFHWETTLTGGWFDCGNAYQVKPEDMLPGQSGSAPLTVYLIHPRQWNDVPTVSRRIVRMDLELFNTLGQSLGTVITQYFN